MTARIHSPQNWTIIIGTPITGGWADGEVLDISPNGDDVVVVQGTDGEVTFGDAPQNLWKLTLNLIQGSAVNAELQALREAGRLTANGSNVVPCLIRNPLGTYEFASPECILATPAGIKLDRTPQNRTWMFYAVDPIIVGA